MPEPSSRRAAREATEAPASTDRRRALIVVAAVLAFVLLGVGALFAGAAKGAAQATPTESATPGASASASAPPSARTVPATIPDPTAVRTCSVDALADSANLANFSGDVMGAASGDVLFTRDGKVPGSTASLLKLLTATAAVKVLGPDYRLTTTVVAGAEPGTIVLVGGGDPTLSRTGIGVQSFYKDAPKLADLAAQVYASIGETTPVTKIVLDASYWDQSDNWNASWARADQTDGYMSEVTALQVDGDRATPTKAVSPRSSDPVMAAGGYFAAALGVPSVQLEIGTAPTNAAKLASVQSQPMSVLIPQMLLTSDGALAESIARVTSLASGSDGSAASLQKVITTAVGSFDLDTDGTVIVDGSGLSAKNRVAPRLLTKLLRVINDGTDNLAVVESGLSVAGQSGGLKDRFAGDNALARDHVTGKVGHIDTEDSLAGIIQGQDGTVLTFAFYAIGSVSEATKTAIDTLTAAVYACGGNLSNR